MSPLTGSSLKSIGLSDWRAQVLVLVVLFVFGVSIGAWLVGAGVSTVARTSAILAHGEHATAQVTAVEETVANPVGAPDDVTVTTTVTFFTSDDVGVDAVLPSAGIQPDYAVGDQVAVVFDREHPASVVLDDDSVIAGQSVGIWVGVLVVVIGAVPGLVAVRVIRKRPIMGA